MINLVGQLTTPESTVHINIETKASKPRIEVLCLPSPPPICITEGSRKLLLFEASEQCRSWWASLGKAKLYWAILGHTGQYWAIVGGLRPRGAAARSSLKHWSPLLPGARAREMEMSTPIGELLLGFDKDCNWNMFDFVKGRISSNYSPRESYCFPMHSFAKNLVSKIERRVLRRKCPKLVLLLVKFHHHEILIELLSTQVLQCKQIEYYYFLHCKTITQFEKCTTPLPTTLCDGIICGQLQYP